MLFKVIAADFPITKLGEVEYYLWEWETAVENAIVRVRQETGILVSRNDFFPHFPILFGKGFTERRGFKLEDEYTFTRFSNKIWPIYTARKEDKHTYQRKDGYYRRLDKTKRR